MVSLALESLVLMYGYWLDTQGIWVFQILCLRLHHYPFEETLSMFFIFTVICLPDMFIILEINDLLFSVFPLPFLWVEVVQNIYYIIPFGNGSLQDCFLYKDPAVRDI